MADVVIPLQAIKLSEKFEKIECQFAKENQTEVKEAQIGVLHIEVNKTK